MIRHINIQTVMFSCVRTIFTQVIKCRYLRQKTNVKNVKKQRDGYVNLKNKELTENDFINKSI